MIDLIVNHSRLSFVNKFANYIVHQSKVDGHIVNSIKVTDFKKFFVVEGNIESKGFFDLNRIKNNFLESISGDPGYGVSDINIIDIIDYHKKDIESSRSFNFYKSIRPLYHKDVIDLVKNNYTFLYDLNSVSYPGYIVLNSDRCVVIDDKLNVNNDTSVSSTFPHGYDFNYGPTCLFYMEYIANHLFDVLNVPRISIRINNLHDIGSFKEPELVLSCDSIYENHIIESMVLDVFDFNLSKFKVEYIDKYDMNEEITNPFDQKPWLVKDRMKDLILF